MLSRLAPGQIGAHRPGRDSDPLLIKDAFGTHIDTDAECESEQQQDDISDLGHVAVELPTVLTSFSDAVLMTGLDQQSHYTNQ